MAETPEIGTLLARAVAAAALGRRGPAAFAYWDAAADARFASDNFARASVVVHRYGALTDRGAARILTGARVKRNGEDTAFLVRGARCCLPGPITLQGSITQEPISLVVSISALLGAPEIWRARVRYFVALRLRITDQHIRTLAAARVGWSAGAGRGVAERVADALMAAYRLAGYEEGDSLARMARRALTLA